MFTGSRPKNLLPTNKAYNMEAWTKLNIQMNDILETIIKYTEETEYVFITGGAQGFDQLAFWCVDRLKSHYPEKNIKNNLVLPFTNQAEQWMTNGLFSQKEYELMKDKADEISYCVNYELHNYKDIRNALMARNSVMINRADVTIALQANPDWNDPKTPSGTADAMRKALKEDKEIIWLKNKLTKNDEIYIDNIEIINEKSLKPLETLMRNTL